MMNFRENLRTLRKERHVSQEVLAEYLGVSQRLVSHYENGKCEPCLDYLCRLAEYFDVSLDTLVGYKKSEDE